MKGIVYILGTSSANKALAQAEDAHIFNDMVPNPDNVTVRYADAIRARPPFSHWWAYQVFPEAEAKLTQKLRGPIVTLPDDVWGPIPPNP